MKKYWKLLQKSQSMLDFEKHLWRSSFRTYLTETEVVDRLLAYASELNTGYTFYQDFLYAIETRDYVWFLALLSEEYPTLPAYYQMVISAF